MSDGAEYLVLEQGVRLCSADFRSDGAQSLVVFSVVVPKVIDGDTLGECVVGGGGGWSEAWF